MRQGNSKHAIECVFCQLLLGMQPTCKRTLFPQWDYLGRNSIFICKWLSIGDRFWGHEFTSFTSKTPSGADLSLPLSSRVCESCRYRMPCFSPFPLALILCGGPNKDNPHRLIYLNAQSIGNGTLLELQGFSVTLLEEEVSLRMGFQISKVHTWPNGALSLSSELKNKDVILTYFFSTIPDCLHTPAMMTNNNELSLWSCN